MFSINYSVLSITIGVYECCMVLSVNTIICQFTTLCLLMLPNRVSTKYLHRLDWKKWLRLDWSVASKIRSCLWRKRTSRNYLNNMLILLIPVKFNVDYGSCEKLEFRTIPSLLRGYLKISLFQIPGLNFIYLYYESNYVSIWRCRAWKSSPGHWKHTSTAMATACFRGQ